MFNCAIYHKKIGKEKHYKNYTKTEYNFAYIKLCNYAQQGMNFTCYHTLMSMVNFGRIK